MAADHPHAFLTGLENALQNYLDSVYSISHSENSVKSYRMAVMQFIEFLDLKYHCKDTDLVNLVKENKIDIYRTLSEFVTQLDKSGKKPSTIKGWLAGVNGYLRYLGIKIYSEDLKVNVRLPKIRRQREEALTKEMIVRLLRVLPSKIQVAVLIACASAIRIGELVQLKISDIDFSTKPTTIRIRAETTKTRESRETYLTEEATKSLKDYLTREFSWKESESYGDIINIVIFATAPIKNKQNSKQDPVLKAENVLAGSLRYYIRKIPELNKRNENSRRMIHFHAFRKFFRTVVGDAVGRDYADALAGHRFYLDTYYNQPIEKRRETYLKAEPYLTISDFTKIEKNLKQITEEQKEMKEEIYNMKKHFEIHFADYPKVLEGYSRR